MKVPAVTIDIVDDGTAYIVTALPWPTIESSGYPHTARLVHTRRSNWVGRSGLEEMRRPTQWTPDKLAAYVKKLMATYPEVTT